MGEYLTPETYPAECSINTWELCRLKSTLEHHTEWRSHVEEWPPTDDMGNVYPIWFTVDDLVERGELLDSNDYPYNPFSGNLEPRIHEERNYCNAPLTKWRDRYPEIRYCSVVLDADYGYEVYCYFHQGRHNVQSAEERLQTGLWTKTVDHCYEKVGPWKKLVAWGTFESLMGESTYEFDPEYREREFDFSDEDFAPDDVNDDDVLHVKCGYPTDHVNPAMALFVAAMQQVQMMSVQPRIMWEGIRPDGTEEGMMETKSVEKAQLTAPPSEHDSTPQEWETIETWNEHHLNLPFSRLIKDQPRLLEMGGVTTDPDGGSDDVPHDDLVLEIEADVDGAQTTDDTGTDPNEFGTDYTSETQKIKESATGNSENA